MSMLEQGAAPSFIEWGGSGDASSTQSPGALEKGSTEVPFKWLLLCEVEDVTESE